MTKSAKRASDEIERDSNRLLVEILDKYFVDTDKKLRPYELGQLREKGIDFIFEIESRKSNAEVTSLNLAKGLFYIQNKGQDKALEPLVKGANEGLISFQLDDVRHIEYFCQELEQPIMITVCDLVNRDIYWCPIQLDRERYLPVIDEVRHAISLGDRKSSKFQIYIDPAKQLCKNGDLIKDRLHQFLTDIKDSKNRLVEDYLSSSDVFYGLDSEEQVLELNTFSFDSSQNILDQIYSYMEVLFREINTYPAHLFKDSSPFRKSNTFIPFYDTFSISTDNAELFDFFESVDIKSDLDISFKNLDLINDVEQPEEKTKKVLSWLSHSLILQIESKQNQKSVGTRYFHSKKCDCFKCRYMRLEFESSFRNLNAKTDDIQGQFRLAYTHCHIGNFLLAEETYRRIATSAKKKKLYVTEFIARFNLSKLYNFIRHHYWDDQAVDATLEQIKKIDLDKYEGNFELPEHHKLIDFIRQTKFFTRAEKRIRKCLDKIKDHYEVSQNGGWSNNNHVAELVSEYAALKLFIQNNFIVFENFLEFRNVTDLFVEGILASYAIPEECGSRLYYLDDWLVNIFIHSANAKTLNKLIARYNLSEIIYKSNSTEGDSLIELLDNFFARNTSIHKAFEKNCEEKNRFFWDRYNSIFSNLTTIVSVTNLPPDQINRFADYLLDFFQGDNSIYIFNIKYVQLFLERKGHLISKSRHKRFLQLALQNGKLHNDRLIEIILIQIKNHFTNIKLSRQICDEFISYSIEHCSVCNTRHSSYLIVDLYRIASEDIVKDYLKKTILDHLNESFDFDLCYYGGIFDVIEIDSQKLELMIEEAKPKSEINSAYNLFTGSKRVRRPMMDMLFNLCYKLKVDLNEERFKDFKGIDPYYDWLLDMNGFDYSLFDGEMG